MLGTTVAGMRLGILRKVVLDPEEGAAARHLTGAMRRDNDGVAEQLRA